MEETNLLSSAHEKPPHAMANPIGLVRRVFALQEERKAEYRKVQVAQDVYVKKSTTSNSEEAGQRYQAEIASATTTFAALAVEMKELIARLKDNDMATAADIVSQIQAEEKERLQTMVQYQISYQQQSALKKGDDDGSRGCIGEEDVEADKLKMLKRRLIIQEGRIAELLEDFRYECEGILNS